MRLPRFRAGRSRGPDRCYGTEDRNRCAEVAVLRQTMLALDAWGEDQRVWDQVPRDCRHEAIARCARLVVRVVQEASNGEGESDEQQAE